MERKHVKISKFAVFLMMRRKWRLNFQRSFPVQNFLEILSQSAFILYKKISTWYLRANMTWLRINLDLDRKILMPDKRIFSIPTAITKTIQSLLYATAWTLAKLSSKIMSTKCVLGKIVQLTARTLHKVINFRTSLDPKIKMIQFPEGSSETFFWKSNLKDFKFQKASETYKFSNNWGLGPK